MGNRPRNVDSIRALLTITILLLGLFVGFKFGSSRAGRVIVPANGNKLDAILEYASRNYVDSISIPDLIEKIIPDALKNLDPHSVYIPASEMEETNEEMEGNFDGIGVYFNMPNDTVVVINAITGGPSERAGLQGGDRIITINDVSVAGNKTNQDSIVKMLRGKPNTKVKVEVKREGFAKPIPFTITRGKIPIKSVDVAYMVSENIGYVKMSKFSRTTHDEFVKAVNKLHKKGMSKLIVDVRDNTGGYLDQAFLITNDFLEKGKMVVYTEGHYRKREEFYSNGKGLCKDDELVVLINESSASASEILAGAIQDNDRGTIVGRRSFGKGLVQEPHMFSDGSGFRLTVSRYYTPTGRCIQRPYSNGKEDYYKEVLRRQEHGEFESADSLYRNDSLRYVTPGGKVVYGGGGINPDVFVPVDTKGITPYFKALVGKNLIYKYSLEFADKHRQQLISINDLDLLKQFFTRQNLLNDFVAYASRNGVTASAAEVKESSEIILAQLQALIGRNSPLDDEGFYPFLEPVDNALQEAMKVLAGS